MQRTPRSAILYQNAERDITLIDIPTSIALAQGRTDTLLSTAPLESPIALKDDYRPKTQKAKVNKAQESSDTAQHIEYKAIIERALVEIRQNVSGAWCAPRKLQAQVSEHGDSDTHFEELEKELERRMREWATWTETKGDDVAFDLQRMMASLGATPESDTTPAGDAATQTWTVRYQPSPSETPATEEPPPHDEPWTSTFHNPDAHPLALTISQAQTPPSSSYSFTIPPHSTLFLSNTTHSSAFRASFRDLTATYTLPRHFDLVLLDPPWPNRSAKRKGAYEQIGGMPYLIRMLRRMDIARYLEHNALVGVWITNKASLRAHVLGLFEAWNVGLVEEWVWVKTTTAGACMFELGDDGAGRRPYEVLLLGRAAPNAWTRMVHVEVVRRRVVVAVPDVHSRKPCLKEMLEGYVRDKRDYAALEVFSRYLVAGWTAWGNEVLKYNWDLYWTGGDRPVETSLAIRTSLTWHFVCPGSCWRKVSGGVEDARGMEAQFPWYVYGGMWKDRGPDGPVSAKKPRRVKERQRVERRGREGGKGGDGEGREEDVEGEREDGDGDGDRELREEDGVRDNQT
ncbi:MT-A70-domain-containing protein [Dothidotthia symphoricarpi CBS 119687]|uniref:MT-A70-domain-containing protein n=1 Tax=Dothidotthia symphoricarpi CBS 119687 TaxID=1392245 RepID=A0A6A6AL31_9PLEO|nr:MT-A70-domain-containing protein [Dothidotthia symphoricarpi CBS 119687]KAF2131634.1 MT-A70-domain-containing protein [Dothidotthia symphoricarpi CBS 119687]